jgi:hypothetical protein
MEGATDRIGHALVELVALSSDNRPHVEVITREISYLAEAICDRMSATVEQTLDELAP